MTQKRRSIRSHYQHWRRRLDTRAAAAQLAPPEEQEAAQKQSANNGGAIVLDTDKLQLPKNILAEEKKKTLFLDADPAVVLIFFLSLIFISFIAYLISQMPDK